jgi:Na+-translocating ferredoxin:NAD+ oxidoreductase RnfD subunit
VGGFYLIHFTAGVFPLLAGIALYGWHAVAGVAIVLISAIVALALWRRVGARGRMLHYSQGLWFAMLLALMLPAHLAGDRGHPEEWALLVAGAFLLVILLWIVGGMGAGRVHSSVAAYLLLAGCFSQLLVPHRVLNRDHLITGEIFRAAPLDAHGLHNDPWISRHNPTADANLVDPASESLVLYTSGRTELQSRKWMDLPALLRDSMPPLEDYIIAGQPGPIGASSTLMVIIGGLFLLYRGAIDYRIPAFTCLAAYVAFMVLPIPVVIAAAPLWRWAAFRLMPHGISVGITFANYEMMASPLLFTAFFLATSAAIRPMTRGGRIVSGALLGMLSAALQLYVSVAIGPYIALLIISPLPTGLDRWFRQRGAS